MQIADPSRQFDIQQIHKDQQVAYKSTYKKIDIIYLLKKNNYKKYRQGNIISVNKSTK